MSKIPENVMSDESTLLPLNENFANLEQYLQRQSDIDDVYNL